MQVPVLRYLLQVVIASTFLVAAGVAAQEAVHQFTKEDYETALNNGLYEEAGVAAKSRLDRAIRAGKVKDFSTVELLNDLAEVQRLSADFATAIQNYELAIEIVEVKRDMLDIALTEPLLGLGLSYLESGRADLALDYLDRALHVRSVNDGPHSIEQAATLEVLADAYRSIGKTKKAADAADRLYLLYERKYSADGIELVPVLLKQGHILGDLGNWRGQRNAYVDAMEIVVRAEGEKSSNMIRPLVGMGNSHLREYFDLWFKARDEFDLPDEILLTQARTYFESAIALTAIASEEEWRKSQDAFLAFGDFYTMTDAQSNARLMYRSAWDLLSGNEERLMQRKMQLERVSPLLQPQPDLTVALPANADLEDSSEQYDTGVIISQFTVTRRGKLREIGLVEIRPERSPKIEAEVKRALTGFIYRPRFERGVAVETADQIIQYEFPYPAAMAVSR